MLRRPHKKNAKNEDAYKNTKNVTNERKNENRLAKNVTKKNTTNKMKDLTITEGKENKEAEDKEKRKNTM